MSTRVTVRITLNSERKLDEIEAFLTQAELPDAFDRLLDELSEQVIQTPERHPDIGRNYLARSAESVEAPLRRETVIELLSAWDDSGGICEYVLKPHLILYLRLPGSIHLLAIRHQHQFAFDLGRADPAS